MGEEGRDGSSCHRGVTGVTGGEETSEKETERDGVTVSVRTLRRYGYETSWVIYSEDRGSVNGQQ